MRLSEAILLGRVALIEKAGTLDGCALGMAATAVGIEREYYRSALPELSRT
jgi:hypothetical protein